MAEETTTVSQVEMDLDDILNPGGSSIITAKKDEKPNIFTRDVTDVKFLDNINKDTKETVIPDLTSEEVKAKIASGELNADGTKKVIPATLTELDEIANEGAGEEDKTKGRKKVDKNGLLELTNKLIEKKLLIPFEDDKPLEEYTVKDFEELLEVNFAEREKKVREEVPGEFFDSLSPELQYAAQYEANGGRDMKSMFKMLAATEEVKQLDPAKENDQELIVRSFLQATKYGSPEEIQEEIDSIKDRGDLQTKAEKFKPKLDTMQEEVLASKLANQEQLKKQQLAQVAQYQNNIYKTLEPSTINGITLDKKTQALLYHGLVQPNYPSVSGKQTNLLGHLLEKYQFVEPNHALVAEALWLLADPEGYRTKVKESNKKEIVTDVARKLKSEENSKKTSVVETEDEDTKTKKAKSGLARPNSGFFKRT